ncbi:MAG: sigma 54-interacting transcriptional regulator [Treponema sp.]|nr:sigma 54-interacting transcriptional regulator [Treponema sp.]
MTGFHTLVYKSPAIEEKIRVIDRAAKTDSSVLILGESGVGKEIFAEQIHLRGSRRLAPFVRVNCAAIPEGLLESELFGHVKGAFTGASGNRKGRFEMADGGTVFLDEIGDIPPALQAKLLRVLQEKTFEKLGSDKTLSVDVRILAATNRDIEAMVGKGEFRGDLYYRLNVLPLFIPPLRQRTEDIPELARFFLSRFMSAGKRHFEGFSEDAIEAMLTHSWPGNVRELENCVERACVIAGGDRIGRADLLLETGPEWTGRGSRNLKTALNVFKANFIRNVLDENGWNRTETAKALDIQRTHLSRLIKEFGITKEKGTDLPC